MRFIGFGLAGVLGLACIGSLLAFAANIDKNTAYMDEAAQRLDDYAQGMDRAAAAGISMAALETDPILRAMVHSDRTRADIKDDSVRKVWEVLQFTQVKPGENVLELEAGSGYYTELLSFVLGEQGRLAMQNPPEFDEFITEDVLAARLGKNGQRLPNVRLTKSSFDELDAPDDSVDLVTWFLGPHELWMTNAAGEMTLGDPVKTYAEIYRVLKPGGRFVALDKSAPDYTLEHESSESHKISPKHVIARAKAAGFVFTESSDILSDKQLQANGEKKYDINVVDPSKRVSTDRFLHLYTKPE